MKRYKLYEVSDFSAVSEMLEAVRKKAGGSVAFKYKEKDTVCEISYGEFCHDVDCLASALDELNISAAHVACLSENRYEWINTFLSVLTSDNVFIPIDRDIAEGDIINLLNHSDAELLFCSGQYENLIRDNSNALEKLKYVICFDRTEDDGIYLSFRSLFERGESALAISGAKEFHDRDTKALKMIIYTSGTNSSCKGIMLSEENIVSCLKNGLMLSKPEGSCLSMLPYSHAYEAVCGILGGLCSQATVCINDSPRNIATNLKLFKPTYFLTVPALLEAMYQRAMKRAERYGQKAILKSRIAAAKAVDNLKLNIGKGLFASLHKSMGGKLRRIYCGGAPLRAEVAEFFCAAGIEIYSGYGLTEASPLVSVNPDSFNDCHTVGVPLPCVEINIVDPARDNNGEIFIKGPTVMMGYYKEPELTAEVINKQGWLMTGDRGRLTEKGQLIISGRSKDLIILSNGRIVHPEEIEGYLYKIPYIKEVVVYGIREESGIKELCAEVFMDPEKQSEDIEAQTEKLRHDVEKRMRRFPTYKQISRIVVRPQEFPKTANNKIKRNELGI